MQKKSKYKIVFTTALASLLIIPQMSFASYSNSDAFFYTTPSTGTVAAIPHWTDSSVSTHGYTTYFSNARTRWDEVTGAAIGWSQQQAYKDAFVRFYVINDSSVAYSGLLQPFDSNGNLISNPDLHNTNWYKAHAILNKGFMNSYSYSSNEIQKVAVHELGHLIGLRHQPDNEGPIDSVMVQGKLSFTAPGSIDKNNAAWKY